MKYLRTHKEGLSWHRCEVSDNAPASHYTDGTIPQLSAIWKVFEVADSFETDNPFPEIAFMNGTDAEGGLKWKHSDNKWYELKAPKNHTQLYDIETGETSCYLSTFPENLETEII